MSTTTTTTATTTRLHITPFTPELLSSILPPSIRASATDISFHAIPTFPENNYGYVTLPTMEADKIRKKLHGSILKGKKFKVEKAKPVKRIRAEFEDDGETEDKQPDQDKDKKRKSVSKTEAEITKKRKSESDGVIDGHELPSDRRVKRGWTEPVSVKKERRKEEKMNKEKKEDKDNKDGGAKKPKLQPKSKYTEKAECLFRTHVPPNKVLDGTREDKMSKKKKKGKSEREVVVHEFATTVTHPSFLRAGDEGKAPTMEFVEGKGWLDSSGNVKEEPSERIRKDGYRPGQKPGAKEKKIRRSAPSSGEELVQPTSAKAVASKEEVSSEESEGWTSSSGDSSSAESGSDSESDDSASSTSSDDSSVPSHVDGNLLKREGKNGPAITATDTTQQSTSEPANSGSTEMSNASKEKADAPPSEVHPLEALFKKPRPDDSQNEQSQDTTAHFSFFGNDDLESSEGEEEGLESTENQTPFTRKDLLLRALRSGAPTPDTALVSRNEYPWEGDENISSGDEDAHDEAGPVNSQNATTAESAGVTEKVESEFTKWFWEHRGENNRAWKRRRREAAKEQRQRENRRKGLKGRS